MDAEEVCCAVAEFYENFSDIKRISETTDLNVSNQHVELEFRAKQKFIDEKKFIRIVDILGTYDIHQYNEASYIQSPEDNLKYRSIAYENCIVHSTKERLLFKEFSLFNLVMSLETTINLEPKMKIKEIVAKTRLSRSYNSFRVDLTYWQTGSKTVYQVEIEFLPMTTDFLDTVKTLAEILNPPKMLLTIDDIRSYLEDFRFQNPITPSVDELTCKNPILGDGFYITPKMDGERRIFACLKDGIFGLTMAMESCEVAYAKTTEDEFILDCEFFDGEYYAFDAIYDNQDLRTKPFHLRYDILMEIKKRNSGIKVKEHTYIEKFDDVVKYSNEVASYSYKTDGFVITGKYSLYQSSDVYKIKDKNTIDFLVNNGKLFYVSSGGLKEFSKLCVPENIDSFNGNIIEFAVDAKSLVPIKIREDKKKPNFERTVNSILKAVRDGLDTSIFSPFSSTLLRRYHNNVKIDILSKCSAPLLDIGTGKGGDIRKWAGIRIVYCVERDDDAIIEMGRRLQVMRSRRSLCVSDDPEKFRPYFESVCTPRQIRENIRGLGDNYIVVCHADICTVSYLPSMFRYVTCFFMLNMLSKRQIGIFANRLKEHTQRGCILYIIFMDTLDRKMDDINCGCISFKDNGDGTTVTTIKGSKVEDLIETKLDVNYVLKIFRKNGFEEVCRPYRLKEETFLCSEHRRFSSFYNTLALTR